MKGLIKEALISGDFYLFQVVALVLFVLVMAGVILWIMRPGASEYYEYIGRDALKGEHDE